MFHFVDHANKTNLVDRCFTYKKYKRRQLFAGQLRLKGFSNFPITCSSRLGSFLSITYVHWYLTSRWRLRKHGFNLVHTITAWKLLKDKMLWPRNFYAFVHGWLFVSLYIHIYFDRFSLVSFAISRLDSSEIFIFLPDFSPDSLFVSGFLKRLRITLIKRVFPKCCKRHFSIRGDCARRSLPHFVPSKNAFYFKETNEPSVILRETFRKHFRAQFTEIQQFHKFFYISCTPPKYQSENSRHVLK